MRVLIIQENGHHNPNRIYRECFALQRCFQEYDNITADVWGQRHNNFKDKPNFNNYDVIIMAENYDMNGWVPHAEIAKSKAYKIIWAIDSHSRGIQYYRYVRDLGKYDLMLCSIKHHIDDRSVWFPNAYDDMMIKPLRVEKRSKLGFCGSGGGEKREALIKVLLEKFKKDFIFDNFVIGDDMVRAINSYDIHFNLNILDDINYRSFETIGCGIPLLTNHNYQYDELGFVDGKNCIFYNNQIELIDKASHYMNNQQLLPAIAHGGLELSKKHSYRARIKHLIKHLSSKI